MSETGLTVNIHVSTKTCVTGNNVMLRKALLTSLYNSVVMYIDEALFIYKVSSN